MSKFKKVFNILGFQPQVRVDNGSRATAVWWEFFNNHPKIGRYWLWYIQNPKNIAGVEI